MPLEHHTSRPEGISHLGPVGRHPEGSTLPPEASYGKGRGVRGWPRVLIGQNDLLGIELHPWVTYYQVTGPDSASAAIAAAAPKSRMKLISNTQRMAHKLRETWLPNC